MTYVKHLRVQRSSVEIGLLALTFYNDGYGVFAVFCLMCMCLHCISAFGRVHRPAGLMVLPAVPSATKHLWTGPRFAYLSEMWVILSLSMADNYEGVIHLSVRNEP